MSINLKKSWKKKGLIIQPNRQLSWMRSHCMIPSPYILGDGLVKVYFSGRDDQNRSHIGYAVCDMKSECNVLELSSRPVLTPGELGCFDDNGVTPSCIKEVEGHIYLYYIGWNPGSTVRMHLFGGLAISKDGGKSFQRWSRAPIIERCQTDPYLNTAPWVVNSEDGYRMYYVSGVEWQHKDLPRYNIKVATSKNGRDWVRDGRVCIDFQSSAENALARPYVVFEDGVWKMWFSHKGHTYRLGYAESFDGLNWIRKDEIVGLSVGDPGEFDSEMVEYAAVVKHEDHHFMFYNGNGYGIDGIGLAVEE
jgi:predicted GH43/DUF377 family glycosyl hydrolase